MKKLPKTNNFDAKKVFSCFISPMFVCEIWTNIFENKHEKTKQNFFSVITNRKEGIWSKFPDKWRWSGVSIAIIDLINMNNWWEIKILKWIFPLLAIIFLNLFVFLCLFSFACVNAQFQKTLKNVFSCFVFESFFYM